MAAAGAVVLGAGLAACTPDAEPTPTTSTSSTTEDPTTPSPTASPTETESPTPTLEEQNIEAAKQTVMDYYATLARVGEMGHATWTTDLAPYWGSEDLQRSLSAYYQQLAVEGRTTAGSPILAGFEVTGYVADGTGQNRPLVDLEVCVDTSAVTAYDQAGEALERTPPYRFITELQLLRQSETLWSINKQDVTDRSC